MAITHPSFGTLDDNRIIFFDTTLRDGEQSPGFSMNLEEKLRMAEALAELALAAGEADAALRLGPREEVLGKSVQGRVRPKLVRRLPGSGRIQEHVGERQAAARDVLALK